jgi:hypothetical protein
MGTAVRPAKTSPGPWNAFADVDMFVDAVLAELETMTKDGTRPMRSGPKATTDRGGAAEGRVGAATADIATPIPAAGQQPTRALAAVGALSSTQVTTGHRRCRWIRRSGR